MLLYMAAISLGFVGTITDVYFSRESVKNDWETETLWCPLGRVLLAIVRKESTPRPSVFADDVC